MQATMIETWRGYEIKTPRGYVKSCRKGVYSFVTDYLYSAKYTEKTAKRHVKALELI